MLVVLKPRDGVQAGTITVKYAEAGKAAHARAENVEGSDRHPWQPRALAHAHDELGQGAALELVVSEREGEQVLVALDLQLRGDAPCQ